MDKQTFIEMYAPLAVEQQQKYGIPASITLAQMALESGWGEGRAIKEANNAFCVKGTYNGNFILISDDKPNEKFKAYPSLQASFDDHSKVLTGKHYAHCQGLASTDYKGWAYGLQSGASTGGRYATDSGYSKKLIDTIEANGLARFDQMGLSPARRVDHQVTQPWGQERGRFSFPVDAADGRLEMTSDYGHRNLKGHENHHGIDIGVPVGTRLLATEDHGKVIEAGWDSKGGGNYVKVQYDRPDGSNYQVAFLHMSRIDVKKGDIVNAGQQVGLSGNTGSSTGPHLDMRIRVNGEYIDPKKYLAEIAVRGGIDTTLVRQGGTQDLLARYKAGVSVPAAGPSSVLGTDIAALSQNGLVWGNAKGQPVEVGEISVSSIDGKYSMTAVINGQRQSREISKEDYDKFQASGNVERLFLFDKAYEDVAMTSASGIGQDGQQVQNPLNGLMAMMAGDGQQDFMSWFLDKNGGGMALSGGGDILGEIIGMVVGGLTSLGAMLDADDETMVMNLREMVSADITPKDQARIDAMKRDGINPSEAKMLSQTNAEAQLTSLEQDRQQQQQMTMRG